MVKVTYARLFGSSSILVVNNSVRIYRDDSSSNGREIRDNGAIITTVTGVNLAIADDDEPPEGSGYNK